MLYSRSYGRDSSFRPTLERLAAICFERRQWDNAWKAAEALLERYGATLSGDERATFLSRSIVADVHIGQRGAAIAKLKVIVTRGPSYVPDAGIRDVAESWAGMHIEPRLVVEIEPRRRDRVLGRAAEILSLAEAGQRAQEPDGAAPPGPSAAMIEAVRPALEVIGAFAVGDGRWQDALAIIERLAADDGLGPERRADFLVAGGDICARQYGDETTAKALYDRARELWPGHPRFAPPVLP